MSQPIPSGAPGEKPYGSEQRDKHHIWCNFYMRGPAEDCEMCKMLKKEYPEDLPPEEMMKKYFPQNIRRT